MFANGPGDLDSILGRVIPKTFKMVLDTSLLNTQQYKVFIKGKGVAPLLHLGVVAIEKEIIRVTLDYCRQQLIYLWYFSFFLSFFLSFFMILYISLYHFSFLNYSSILSFCLSFFIFSFIFNPSFLPSFLSHHYCLFLFFPFFFSFLSQIYTYTFAIVFFP